MSKLLKGVGPTIYSEKRSVQKSNRKLSAQELFKYTNKQWAHIKVFDCNHSQDRPTEIIIAINIKIA